VFERRSKLEKEYINVNKEAYNTFASQHLERHKQIGKYDLTDEDWKRLLSEKLLKSNVKNNVLEIGPGTGRILKILEEDLKCRTIAVELAEEMIKYAKIKSPNTVFIEDNILNVRFAKETFDAIFMGALIHNFPKEDAKKLLELVYNWIKFDGKILIYTTIHEKSEEGYYEKKDYSGNIVRFRKKFTEEELQELIEDLNFKITYKMYTEEPDRNKKWLTYIIKKSK